VKPGEPGHGSSQLYSAGIALVSGAINTSRGSQRPLRGLYPVMRSKDKNIDSAIITPATKMQIRCRIVIP
jgi:hypothetical protein